MSGPQRGDSKRPIRSTSRRTGGPASSGSRASTEASTSLYERYKDALRRGHVAALRGRHDVAIDAYGEAARIAPDRALPHVSIGGILAKMDRLDDAIDAYRRALGIAPRDEVALRGLGEVLARLGRRAEAAAAVDRLSDALDAGGRLTEATDAARRALELAESRTRRAQLTTLVGRLRAEPAGDETAQRALEQALGVLAATAVAESSPDVSEATRAEPERPPGPVDVAGAETEAPIDSASGKQPEPPGDDVQPVAEPAGLGIALGAAAETHLYAGDLVEAHEGLLAAARAHRRAGRLVAAVDACDLAIAIAPADPDLHLLLAELYLDRGWRALASEKLQLLGRIANLDADSRTRTRICETVNARLPDDPRLAELCA